MSKSYTIVLTEEELELVLSALDSHKYWQLADQGYRDSGFVRDPGSDDPELAEEIAEVEKLETKLEAVRGNL